MLINELINKYIGRGYSFKDAQNLAAEEIIIKKISSSPLANNITLKGGIVMFNLSKNARRVTQDIDFDFIRYSLDNESIYFFIEKLNDVNDGILVTVRGSIEKLHQENYKGARVNLLLIDRTKTKLKIKLDIGVHTYCIIEQKTLIFTFENDKDTIKINVNPSEQIFVEKILSLGRLGVLSTRYKDIYDLYYLIENKLINIDTIREILPIFLISSSKKPDNIIDLINFVIDTLEDKYFALEANKPAFKWIDIDYEILKKTIIEFILKL